MSHRVQLQAKATDQWVMASTRTGVAATSKQTKWWGVVVYPSSNTGDTDT